MTKRRKVIRAAAARFGLVVGVCLMLGVAFFSWTWIAEAYTSGGDMGVVAAFAAIGLAFAFGAAIAWPSVRGLLALAVVVALAGCTRVDPGYEGIKVDMLGSDRGQAYPIVYGRVWYNPYTHDIYQFPTFVQRVIWTAQEGEGDPSNDQSFTFRSKEGYAFNVDVGMGFSFLAGKTPEVFVAYRRTPEAIIDGPFRDIVREAFVTVGSRMEGLGILGSEMPRLNQDVTALVRENLKAITKIDYVNVVGKPRVDSRVEQAINSVIQATQQANEAQERVRMREAEARQQVAQANGNAEALLINAKAKADAIRIEAQALQQYGSSVLQMRAIEKWNGTMPMVTGDGAMPFITVPTPQR